MIEHLGFVGTRAGMTAAQLRSVRACFVDAVEDGARVFHHGDCVGADEEAYWMARDFELILVAHPAVMRHEFRARTVNDERREMATPPIRNEVLIEESDLLIAAPARDSNRHKRGGVAWHAVRHARRVGKPVWLVFYNGMVETS